MINDHINISDIETHLDGVIRKHICKNCYAGTLPSTLKEGVWSYAVIACESGIRDLNAFGEGIVNIYLYARPSGGVKNVPELSKMERAFSKALREDLFDSEHYVVGRQTSYSDTDYDSNYDMHFIVKAIHLKIK